MKVVNYSCIGPYGTQANLSTAEESEFCPSQCCPNCTTKDTKSAKGSKYETLDAVFEFCVVEVDQQADLH
jgi:hypothetical protein